MVDISSLSLLHYYFNDGSDIQTIRKENPFNFNIQAGVRLTY